MQIAFKIKAKNGVLQKFIEDRGWNQADFSRAMKIKAKNLSIVGNWFNLRTYPSPKYIKRLEKLTGLLIEEIFPDILQNKEVRNKISRPITVYKEIELDLLPFIEMQQISYNQDFDKFDLKEEVSKVLNFLAPRSKKIIEMRMGLNGQEESTLDEIAIELGLTRERIRQIETIAINKIKKSQNSNLREFY